MIAQIATGITSKYTGSALASSLTGGLWRDEAKQGVSFPYGVFTVIDSLNTETFTERMEYFRIQFDLWAKYSKYTASTIAFNENAPSADSITDSASGLTGFGAVAGCKIGITGSTSNDKIVTSASISAGTITVSGSDDFTAELAGSSITLSVVDAKEVLDLLETALRTLYDEVALTISGWSNTKMRWIGTRPGYSEDDQVVGVIIEYETYIQK